jgi:hypothetical protein
LTQYINSFLKLASFAACLMALVVSGPVRLAAQNANLDFTLINQTGVVINSVYIGPHDSDEWGDDVMEDEVLANGESVDITFHPKAKAKLWDLRIEDKKGESLEWESLDLTEISELTIKIVKGKAVATWK